MTTVGLIEPIKRKRYDLRVAERMSNKLKEERSRRRKLEQQYDELEERYQRKRNVASIQESRADILAEELHECMAKRKKAESEAKKMKRTYGDVI